MEKKRARILNLLTNWTTQNHSCTSLLPPSLCFAIEKCIQTLVSDGQKGFPAPISKEIPWLVKGFIQDKKGNQPDPIFSHSILYYSIIVNASKPSIKSWCCSFIMSNMLTCSLLFILNYTWMNDAKDSCSTTPSPLSVRRGGANLGKVTFLHISFLMHRKIKGLI